MNNDKSVLVVDDNADNRSLVATMLRLAGYDTWLASDGAAALDQLQSALRLPCLIILDLAMPVMDGWQFRSAQLARSELCSIPVVLYSAHPELREHARRLGAAGFLQKPIDFDRLLAAVKMACP